MIDVKGFIEQLKPVSVSKMIGIYLLYQDDEIVYVGQSTNIGERVYFHVGDGEKKFNRCAAYQLPNGKSISNQVSGIKLFVGIAMNT